MSIPGLIAALVLLLVLLLYVLYPLIYAPEQQDISLNRQRERALAYYERILTNIRDLDEDHVTGKIAAVEYSNEREVWVQRGIKLLRLLDELDAKHSITDSADDAEIDIAIEAAIAAQRQKQAQEVG